VTDREIIEKLATEFLGWQFTDDVEVIGEHVIMGCTSTIWYRRDNGSIGITGAVTCHIFDPLHDPAACALVLDEIERRGWIYVIRYGNGKFSCHIIGWGGTGIGFQGDVETEERAVCLAAAEACGVTV